MPTVREATFELFRAHGMTTIFGNPGSTELPMLADFPDDFTYVLGLQELAVMGMADGFAQATGRPTHVNLHTAPGVGNAVGGIFNAQANKSPLVITAGQQVRPHITIEANLTNRDATVGPQPYVKWSHEPPRAQEVPGALARAIHLASLPPRGPVFVSIPMDDWGAEADEDRDRQRDRARRPRTRAAPIPAALAELADRLQSAGNPVLIAGPDIDASGGWDAAVALAERQRLPVWASPATGGSRIGFPENHPQFLGVLPPAIGALSQTLAGHDLLLVVGSSVFPYYPYIPGPLLPEGASLVAITSDPGEAARAPMGEAIVGDVAGALAALVGAGGRIGPPGARAASGLARPGPQRSDERVGGDGRARRRLAGGRDRRARVAVEHAGAAQPPAPVEARQLLLRRQRRAWVRNLRRRRRAARRSAAGRWCACSARARRSTGSPRCGRRSPTRRRSRSWCCATTSTGSSSGSRRSSRSTGAPGLELPALDTAAVARGYGVPSVDADSSRGADRGPARGDRGR